MLSPAVLVGVPLVALLAAAVYILKRTQTESTAHGSGPGFGFTGPRADQSSNANRHTNARRRNARPGRDNAESPNESPDSGLPEDDQCGICFEEVMKVRLYPCQHSDICKGCVMKLLVSNRRLCPFCRTRIDGYEEINTGHRFG